VWLVRGNDVLASLEVASTSAARRRGLLGRDGIEGALLLRPARSVHTLGMRFAIDVAHLDAEGTVVRVATMKPWRLGAYVHSARSVVEAEAGSFARWGVTLGDVLEVKGGDG
jgi:uncharacterized membrane protein (UPF0127 family)